MARVIRAINKDPDKEEKRIGLIAPGGGRINEEEFPLVCPAQFSFLITALRFGNRQIDKIVAPPAIENAAKALASAGADMICMCGIPVVFFQPPGYEKEIIGRIEKVSGLPAGTMSGALVESLQRLNIKQPVVITHYNERLNEEFKKFLSNYGIQAANVQSVIEQAGGSAGLDQESKSLYSEFVRKAASEVSRVDGILLSGGGTYNTVEMIAPLEQELGLPVISGGLSAIWKCLRMMGFREPIQGYGQLLTLS